MYSISYSDTILHVHAHAQLQWQIYYSAFFEGYMNKFCEQEIKSTILLMKIVFNEINFVISAKQ